MGIVLVGVPLLIYYYCYSFFVGWVPIDPKGRQHCWHATSFDIEVGLALVLQPDPDDVKILQISAISTDRAGWLHLGTDRYSHQWKPVPVGLETDATTSACSPWYNSIPDKPPVKFRRSQNLVHGQGRRAG